MQMKLLLIKKCNERQCLPLHLVSIAILGVLLVLSLGNVLIVHASFHNLPVAVFHDTRIAVHKSQSSSTVLLDAPPKYALPDIVIPNIFQYPIVTTGQEPQVPSILAEEDPRVWVPQTECLSFRPLCLCTSQGYYVNLLKFKGGGVLGRHRHSSPVHALTLKGKWGYKEHDWHASPGTYVFEPPGETHTLVVDEDCDEMITLFHVTGSLLYVEEGSDKVIGFDDVFTKIEKARKWYTEVGLGEGYVEQFIR